jgi:hypothetical protein
MTSAGRAVFTTSSAPHQSTHTSWCHSKSRKYSQTLLTRAIMQSWRKHKHQELLHVSGLLASMATTQFYSSLNSWI